MAVRIRSEAEMENLATRAASGDNEALAELGREAEKMGRALNQRMRTLEKAGKTGDAYKRIEKSLGRSRASQARTGSAEQLFRNWKASAKGLGYKESTLSGIKEVDTKTANRVAQAFGHKEPLTADQVNKMNRFLGSKAFDEMRRTFGSKDQAVQDSVDIILSEQDDLQEDFIDAIEEYDSDEDNIFDLLDGYVDF